MSEDTSRLTASRLGALLSVLQSFDFIVESLTRSLPNKLTGWVLVTVIEAWKAACRIRLLSTRAPGQLLSSFSLEQDRQPLVSVVQQLRTVASTLRSRLGHAKRDTIDDCSTLSLRVGEVLHAVQPVAYLVLLLVQMRGANFLSHGWRRRLPWLTALALEVVSVQLCSIGVRHAEGNHAESTRPTAVRKSVHSYPALVVSSHQLPPHENTKQFCEERLCMHMHSLVTLVNFH